MGTGCVRCVLICSDSRLRGRHAADRRLRASRRGCRTARRRGGPVWDVAVEEPAGGDGSPVAAGLGRGASPHGGGPVAGEQGGTTSSSTLRPPAPGNNGPIKQGKTRSPHSARHIGKRKRIAHRSEGGRARMRARPRRFRTPLPADPGRRQDRHSGSPCVSWPASR